MKVIINPFVSHTLSYAVFMAESKKEILEYIQEIHSIVCTNCNIHGFGFIDEKEKACIESDNGYSLWIRPAEEDNDIVIKDNDEFPELSGKSMFCKTNIELARVGDKFMFYIGFMNDTEFEEPDLENIHLAYELIFRKLPQMNKESELNFNVFDSKNKIKDKKRKKDEEN